MVVVEHVTRLSDRRSQTSSETFPDDTLEAIRSAVEAVSTSVFEDTAKHKEIGEFDASIADALPRYEYEGDAAGGYNPNCKLWSHLGFNYSVDLYNADGRIAIEVEKSERKDISDDLLKFQKGYRIKKAGRRSSSDAWSCR